MSDRDTSEAHPFGAGPRRRCVQVADDRKPVASVVTIVNTEGFHTRPVMKFVDLAQRFSADIRVASLDSDGEAVNGKSAMELMLLAATKGTRIRVEGVGDDAADAVESLIDLVRKGFCIEQAGEEE